MFCLCLVTAYVRQPRSMRPPAQLDGADVLWWAWSGREPFGELCNASERERWVFGFAVCRYGGSYNYCRFSCNEKWQVVNDSMHADKAAAKAAIPSNYDAGRVAWQSFGAQ